MNKLEGLDRSRKNRDYLFGRLLGVADSLAKKAMELRGVKGATIVDTELRNFVWRPCHGWTRIKIPLLKARMLLMRDIPDYLEICEREELEIMNLFKNDDFCNDNLTEEFLLSRSQQEQSINDEFENKESEN